MTDRLVIRSYRRVFKLDRRLYYFDPPRNRWPVPFPGGVPLIGLGYFVLAVFGVLLLSRLPILGAFLGILVPPVRYILLPAGIAFVAFRVSLDGRSAHRYVFDWLAFKVRKKRTVAGRPVPMEGEPVAWRGRLAVRHDADSPVLQRARIRGLVKVTFNVPVRLRFRHRSLTAHGAGASGAPQVLVTHPSQNLEVHP